MATITLRKSKFDGIQSVLDKLKASFKDYEASLNELKRTAEGVDSSACSLEDAIDDIASSSDSEKEKVEKIQKLNKKIETFVNTAIQREKSARDKIVEKKNEFYKRYKNLKPDCEKGYLERACETVAKINEAINKWVMDHLDIIIAAIIVLAAIVICILCPAAVIAIIGVIVCALSAVMGIADMVCMATHGGKDIATVLAENGHGTLAKIWSGVSLGLDIASIILPVGAGIKFTMEATGQSFKAIMKNSVKNGFKKLGNVLSHPLKTIGTEVKNGANGIKTGFKNFANTCKKNGFLKTVGSKTWSGLKSITGIDDIQNLKNIKNIKNSMVLDGATYNRVMKDGNFDSFAKYSDDVDVDKAISKTMSQAKVSDTHSSLNSKMRNNLQGEFIDNTIDKISTDEAFAKSFKEATGIDTSLRGKRNPEAMTKTQFKNELKRCGYTLHEDFDRSIIQIVPTDINATVHHNGGTARAVDSLFDADSRNLGTVYRNTVNGGKARVGSIYGGANYTPSEYAQKAIEQYKKYAGVRKSVETFVNNKMQDQFRTTFGGTIQAVQ